MKAMHFSVSHRTRGTQKAPAVAHVRYITRAQAGAAEHVGYITRTTQQTREDLVATGYGNLPAWAHQDPAAFFAEADRWERMNGRSATQITAALPRGLDRGELAATVEAFITHQCGTAHAYVWGIHETTASDGGRYPHVHIAFSERRDTGRAQSPQQYFSQTVNPKERTFHDRQWPYIARQAWSDTLNSALEAAGSPERVSARSFRDQGVEWRAAPYIDRQTLRNNKSLLRQREQTADTPEALVRRTQEWETRKQVLGITHGMSAAARTWRIGEASRAALAGGFGRRGDWSQGRMRTRLPEGEAGYARVQEQLAVVSGVARNEAHYAQHPAQQRPVAHLVQVRQVLQEDAAHGPTRLRPWDTEGEEEWARTRKRGWQRAR